MYSKKLNKFTVNKLVHICYKSRFCVEYINQYLHWLSDECYRSTFYSRRLHNAPVCSDVLLESRTYWSPTRVHIFKIRTSLWHEKL